MNCTWVDRGEAMSEVPDLVSLSGVVQHWGHLHRGDGIDHDSITVAGRIASIYREAGSLAFAMLSDGTAELQVILTPSRLGQEQFEAAAARPAEDQLAVFGAVTRTRRGVLSIVARGVLNGRDPG